MSDYRLNQYLALCGIASRRGAEKLIKAGKVTLHGRVIDDFSLRVNEDMPLQVNGKQISPIKQDAIIMLNKPIGLICTHANFANKPNIFSILPSQYHNWHYIGRLDKNSSGLLLLTNMAKIKRFFEMPINNFSRTYHVKINGEINQQKLNQIRNGITLANITYRPCEIIIQSKTSNNHWLVIKLFEGKNREIRKMMSFMDVKIAKLHRVSYGSFTLDKLSSGKYQKLDNKLFKQHINM